MNRQAKREERMRDWREQRDAFIVQLQSRLQEVVSSAKADATVSLLDEHADAGPFIVIAPREDGAAGEMHIAVEAAGDVAVSVGNTSVDWQGAESKVIDELAGIADDLIAGRLREKVAIDWRGVVRTSKLQRETAKGTRTLWTSSEALAILLYPVNRKRTWVLPPYPRVRNGGA